ncbi:MAG: hypothetical protein LBV14_13580 [Acidovorax sp.]|jgi:hypothetical protein|nr:hypothetical protein [Acidovorax sp.]
MDAFGRQPPRYVPTLTDVVAEGLPIHRPAETGAGAALYAREKGEMPAQALPESTPLQAEVAAPVDMPDAAQLHEEVVARLLARVQPMLETQLRNTVAEVVQSHAELLARSLCAAAEDVVRAAVADAVVQEMQQAPR